MALVFITKNCHSIRRITKPVFSGDKHFSRILTSRTLYGNSYDVYPTFSIETRYSVKNIDNGLYSRSGAQGCLLYEVKRKGFSSILYKQCSTQSNPHKTGSEPCDKEPPKPEPEPKKLSLVQRFKSMYRDYWYVAVPVHMMTSAIWFGSFYYLVRSGFDVIQFLTAIGVSENLLEPLKNSKAGYVAFAFAMYKLITPLRYAVTLGATTYAINRLKAIGWVKPVPSRERIKEMIQVKSNNLQGRITESKAQMKEKRNHVMDEMKRYKTQIRDLKNKVKKM